MNKTQLAAAVAERTGSNPAEARKQVDAVLDSITEAVAAGERVSLLGFGTFAGAERAARTARNPRTGATIDVPAAVVPRFRVGAVFKARVGEGAPAPVVTGTATADPGDRQRSKPSGKGARKAAATPSSDTKPATKSKSGKKSAKASTTSSAKHSTKEAKRSKKSKKGKKKKK